MNLRPSACSATPRELPPVVLVHGWRDTAAKMQPLGEGLRRMGRRVMIPTLAPADGSVGIEVLSEQLERVIHAECPDGKIDLVGFSMGGMISRHLIQRRGFLGRIRKFITIASPHRGTLLAWLSGGPASVQQRPESAFLRDLAADAEMLRTVDFTSFWTPLDLMIFPPTSSCIPEAKMRRLWLPAHPLMAVGSPAVKAVCEVLR